MHKPLDYQREGIIFMKDRLAEHPGVLLCDEMGLGKTLQTLYLLRGIYRVNPKIKTLIITPKTLMNLWYYETIEYCNLKVKIYNIKDVFAEYLKYGELKSDVVVINYDILKANEDILLNLGFNVLICDEAHKLKSMTAGRTRFALKLSNRIIKNDGKIILITGTPVENYPKELYSLLEIAGSTAMNSNEFTRRYCNGRLVKRFNRTFYDDTGSSNEDELKYKLSKIMLRRYTTDVYKDLPEIIHQCIVFPATKEPNTEMKRVIDVIENIGDIPDINNCSRQNFAEYSALRKQQALDKIKDCVEFIENILEEKQKVVIFAHHRDVLAELFKKLKGYNPVAVIGGMTEYQRFNSVRKFNRDYSCRVFIGGINAAGEGLTLTSASVCCHVEINFTPSKIEQCYKRVHRISQKEVVLNYYLFKDKTVDAHILKIVKKKYKTLSKILGV